MSITVFKNKFWTVFNNRTLRLYEDTNRKGSVIISGLEEVIVNNKQEVYNVLDRGSQQRKTAATLMNAHSRYV